MQLLFRKYDKLFGGLFGASRMDGDPERRKFGWTLFLVVKDTAYRSQDHVEVVSLYNMLVCALNFILWRLDPNHRSKIIDSQLAGGGGGAAASPKRKEASPGTPFPTVTAELKHQAAGTMDVTPLSTLEALTRFSNSNSEDVALVHATVGEKVRELLRGTGSSSSPHELLPLEASTLYRTYETILLTSGGLDERVWLNEGAANNLATPSKVTPLSLRAAHEPSPVFRRLGAALDSVSQQDRPSSSSMEPPSSPLAPKRPPAPMHSPMRITQAAAASGLATPVLMRRGMAPPQTPMTSQLEAVNWLQRDFGGVSLHAQGAGPPQDLASFFQDCASGDPTVGIAARAEGLVEMVDFPPDVAASRREMVLRIYYRVLLNLLKAEAARQRGAADCSGLLHNDVFHRSLIAVCLEAVVFSYQVVHLAFPFVLEHCDLQGFDLSKVINAIRTPFERPSNALLTPF